MTVNAFMELPLRRLLDATHFFFAAIHFSPSTFFPIICIASRWQVQ